MSREELINLKDRYEEINKILNEILMVNKCQKKRIISLENGQRKKYTMTLIEMNEWLGFIVDFYRRNNIEISYNDFRNMFPSNTVENRRTNEIINRYMEVFFKNIDNPSSYEFSNVILKMDDLGVLVEENPIFDEIVMAVNKFNSLNKNIFNHLIRENINKHLEVLKIKRVDFDKIDESIEEIDTKIKEIDGELVKYKEIEPVEEMEVKDIDYMDKLCMLITNNRYNDMSEEEKKILISKLPLVVDILIKLRIFDHVKDSYLEYSKDAKYDDILKLVLDKEEKIKGFKEEFEIETDNMNKIESKGGLFKGREIKRIKESVIYLGKSIVQYNGEVQKIINDYLDGFYKKYGDISKIEKQYNIMGMNDNSKLFGVFDFRKLPPDSSIINENLEFSNNLIQIPDMNSLEFKELSDIALNLVISGKVIPMRYFMDEDEIFNISFSR